MTTTITSSTGGRIINVPGGLFHYANTERLLDGNEITVRTVGRPSKVSLEEGLTFDFSAFTRPVKIPNIGTSRIVRFK